MTHDMIDDLNRSAKLFIDSHAASTVEEAVEKLHGFRMHLFIGAHAATSPTHQAALLTALNCGRRTFLGGVSVSGALDAPPASSVTPGATLADAVRHLHGQVVEDICPGIPLVSIGAPPEVDARAFAVRTTFDGWCGGLLPLGSASLPEQVEFTPAGILAGALAVSEVFAHLNGEKMAGYRQIGLSLWDLDASADWRSPESSGSMPSLLPADFWLIGLGHLGQAFLWTIGLMPFANPADVRLFLQDSDVAGGSTESTSVLTEASDKGKLKTRICGDWAQSCGFTIRLIERRFDTDLRVVHDEPMLALCGVDNPEARSILEGAGFATVLEAGLGAGVIDFRLMRTHNFPAAVSAKEIWAEHEEPDVPSSDADRTKIAASRPAAYADLHARGDLDECGLTRLAEVAVGAPFIGMVAAAVLLSQSIRMVCDGTRIAVFNLDLRAPDHRSCVKQNGSGIVLFKTTNAG